MFYRTYPALMPQFPQHFVTGNPTISHGLTMWSEHNLGSVTVINSGHMAMEVCHFICCTRKKKDSDLCGSTTHIQKHRAQPNLSQCVVALCANISNPFSWIMTGVVDSHTQSGMESTLCLMMAVSYGRTPPDHILCPERWVSGAEKANTLVLDLTNSTNAWPFV